MASANDDNNIEQCRATEDAGRQFLWNHAAARVFTLLLILMDVFALKCVFSYYTDKANPSRYQFMQAAMLILFFVALPIVVCQWFVLARASREQMSRNEHRRHKALAVSQLFLVLLIMLFITGCVQR